MNGKAKGGEADFPRDPNGWYVETRASVAQLADAIDFSTLGQPDLIFDPACGGCNVLDVMFERGHPVVGSDIIDRPKWTPGRYDPRRFYRSNFLRASKWPNLAGRRLSIMCNPPYNEPQPMIAEDFMHKALRDVPFRRAAFLVPIGFLAGQGRYERLYSRHRPSHVAICCERPSMPPGEALARLGEDARGGGMEDYCWIVFTEGGPYQTETIFLRPTALAPLPKSDRVRRSDRNSPAGGL
jgi:hypothetical protein